MDAFPELKDFYNEYDELEITEKDRESYEKMLKGLSDEEKALLKEKRNFYKVDLKNHGGLVMPVVLEATFEDGSTKEYRLPAQIWRRNPEEVSKLLITEKKIAKLELDPHRETADVDIENNYFPRRIRENKFRLNKSTRPGNPLRDKQRADEKTKREAEKKKQEEDKKN